VLPVACGDGETGPAVDPGSAGQGGTPAALTDPCEADEVLLPDGSCVRPGIPAEACGDLLVPVDDGCQPILPEAECEPGTMAVLGESSCREIAPCGDGAWGDIPLDASTEHVDGAYTGGASDGSADHPWTTVMAAITAAAPGAIVAIAAGDYVEDVFVHAKEDLQLWGRCPEMVSLSGLATTEQPATLFITDEAPGTTVRSLAITGPKRGLMTLAVGTSVEQVWIHDTERQGIYAVDLLGSAAGLALRDSLIESTVSTAVFIAGSDGVVERSVVRDTLEEAGELGRGVYVDRSVRSDATTETASASLELRGSVLRGNRAEALRIDGADAIVEDSAILDTESQTIDDGGGVGVTVTWHAETGARSAATFSRVVVARSRGDGVLIVGSDLSLDAVVIEDTRPTAAGRYGRGLEVQGDPVASVVTVTRSLIEDNVGAGAFVASADVTVEDTIVRRTRPEPEGPYEGQYGFGLVGQASEDLTALAKLTARRCLLIDNHVAGASVFGGEVDIESCRIATTQPTLGLFGDGVLVYNYRSAPAAGRIATSLISDNARAGVAAFGTAVSLEDNLMRCNALDLNGEATFDSAFELADEGGNVCGCDASAACRAVSASLEPPEPPGRP
jgi:hypothetical protein